MSREELQEFIRNMKLRAQCDIRQYIDSNYPWIDPKFVDAVINALGEISVDEAIEAINKEAERQRS